MFTTIDSFLNTFKSNAEGTTKVLESLTDESLSQPVAEDHRTLGRIAWHAITSIPEMMNRTGLKVASLKEDAAMPAAAADMAVAYRNVADELLEQIKANWQDGSLQVEDDMYGFKWKRGFTLWILLMHEIHHRGQMTVLMRQAGLKVPGVCGPSKEEWDQYGMETPSL